MKPLLAELVERNGLMGNPPAEDWEIDDAAAIFDHRTPPAIEELWAIHDGTDVNEEPGHFLAPWEVSQICGEGGVLEGLTAVPIYSDYHLVAVETTGPLAGYCIFLPHDDGPSVLYRSLESFAVDFDRATKQGDGYWSEVAGGDFGDDVSRTPGDRAAAAELLALPHKEVEWNFAAQLFDDSDIDAFRTLLETDHFVRRDVVDRLLRSQDPALTALLKEDQAEFRRFAEQLEAAARDHGLPNVQLEDDCLRIGESWKNLDGFFYKRNVSDFTRRAIAHFEDSAAGRDPRLNELYLFDD